MSKKTYVALAAAIQTVRAKYVNRDAIACGERGAQQIEDAINALAIEIADALQRNAPDRFRRSLFLGACKVPSPEVA